ncbi:MAG: flap endonuclease [Myxococcales bacterium]|nr:flap endonuclease [Myxococcales bacterium]MDH5308114.1 flap endonuclease [Myxococcales bacterium]MDH5565826.1 flap endonuclease [Myxococcales bacterium]
MQIHLIDGTFELFRHHYALPSHINRDGQEVAATRGVLASLLTLLEAGATHVGVATDHVIESFRNDLYPGYKTGDGIETALRSQFELLEETLAAAGFALWPMSTFEADDALATAAARAAADPRVEQVLLCTPDKDLAQCVVARRIVQLDRRRGVTLDAAGVVEKFGVEPASIPDYLALVGDSADGFPGLPGWGAKSAAAVLARYRHLEAIPERADAWRVKLRGAAKLAETLARERERALLFRRIATLVCDGPEVGAVDDWRWRGPRGALEELCDYLEAPRMHERATRAAQRRA